MAAYVTPQTSGTITRNVTSGVNLLCEWKANLNNTANTVSFTLTYYLQTTKSVSVRFYSHPGSLDDVTTKIDWSATSVRSVGEYMGDNDYFSNSTFTSGGNSITASLGSGKHYIYTTTTNEPFYGNDNYYNEEFAYPFVIGLAYWSIQVDGTTYSVDGVDTEIPPINVDKRSTASIPATYLGDFAAVTVKKIVSNYKHTLTYKFGNLTGDIATLSTSSTYSWRVPWDFLSQFDGTSSQATGTLICKTYRDNGEYYGETTSTFIAMLDVSTAGPTFNPVVTDTNQTTIALTGNNKVLVKYFSNAYVESGAAAQGNATLTKQTIENAGKIVNAGFTTFDKVESGIFKFTAIDSRSFGNATSYTASFIDYSKLTCNLFAGYPTTFGDLNVKVEGNYFNSTFGDVANTLTLQYRYKEQGGSYGNWITITPSKNDSNYSIEFEVTGLDYKQPYVFQARAVDKLMEVLSAEKVVIGYPIFDWGQNDFQFNVDVNMREELAFENGKNIYGTNTNGSQVQAFNPCDSSNNTVVGFGNYQNENGDTLIYGDNVHILANNDITFNGTSLHTLPSISSGTWTPRSSMFSNPTAAKGNYLRVGDTCIINFFYQANATATFPKITFSGLPFTPDSNYRWQSGGGNMSGGNLGLDKTAFSGWTIELTDGDYVICGRSVGYRNATDYGPTATSGYVGVNTGATFYASGTIMYKIAS